MLGTQFLMRAKTKAIRIIFAVVIAMLGMEMIYSGLTGRL